MRTAGRPAGVSHDQRSQLARARPTADRRTQTSVSRSTMTAVRWSNDPTRAARPGCPISPNTRFGRSMHASGSTARIAGSVGPSRRILRRDEPRRVESAGDLDDESAPTIEVSAIDEAGGTVAGDAFRGLRWAACAAVCRINAHGLRGSLYDSRRAARGTRASAGESRLWVRDRETARGRARRECR